ncbi:hypothetical protein V1358_09525 [Pseudoalteromonas sp. YIC-656]|uniref:hypothetical protein n=1 Tax=Pseudoalteromonas pernae TaxID=3118054 RepID=UPI003242D699
MKKRIAFTLVIISATCAYFWLSTADSKQSHTAFNIKAQESTTNATIANSKAPKKTFTPTPAPKPIEDLEQCKSVLKDSRNIKMQRQKEYLDQADAALKHGANFDEVTRALIAAGVDWQAWESWRKHVQLRTALSRNFDILQDFVFQKYESPQNTSNNSQVMEELDVNLATLQAMADGSKPVVNGLSNFNLDTLYRISLEYPKFRKQLNENPVASLLVERATELVANVPPELLNDAQLSPVNMLVAELLSMGKTEAATLLMQKYPKSFSNESMFVSPIQKQVLKHFQTFPSASQDAVIMEQLIAASGLDGQTKYLTQHSLLSNDVNLDSLKAQGITVSVSPWSTIPTNDLTIQLSASDSAQMDEYQQALVDACQSPRKWLAERSFSVSQWNEFEESDFVKMVKASAEYNACSNSKKVSENQLRQRAYNILMNQNKTLAQIKQLELDNLNLPEISDAERSALGLTVTRLGLREGFSNEAIINKLAAANLTPNPQHSEAFSAYVGKEVMTLWLKQYTQLSAADALGLANTIAKYGDIAQYQLVEPYLDISSNAIDPLYSHLASIPYRHRFPIYHHVPKDQAGPFLTYLMNNGAQVQSHHLRQMMKWQIEAPEQYQALTTIYPELTVTQPDEYFAVRCD